MAEEATPKAKVAIDWERVESDYRAGILSHREIAKIHGVTHGAIQKRAKRDGWTRNLTAKIHAKADALVAKQAVATEVAMATEAATVNSNAQAIATVRIRHRTDIGKAQALCLQLLDELRAVTTERLTVESIQELLEDLENPNKDETQEKRLQKARDALYKAMSLPSRAGTIKALADSLKTLVTLERQAWGLAEDPAPDPETPTDSFTAEQSEAAYARMRG